MILNSGVEHRHELALFQVRIVRPFVFHQAIPCQHHEPLMDFPYLVRGQCHISLEGGYIFQLIVVLPGEFLVADWAAGDQQFPREPVNMDFGHGPNYN